MLILLGQMRPSDLKSYRDLCILKNMQERDNMMDSITISLKPNHYYIINSNLTQN